MEELLGRIILRNPSNLTEYIDMDTAYLQMWLDWMNDEGMLMPYWMRG